MNKVSIWCEDCEHFENHTLDDFISARCRKYNEDLEYYDGFLKCEQCYEDKEKVEQ